MTIRSKRTLPGRWPAALALAAGLIVVGAGPAGAQWFRWPSWDSALAPAEVEHMIEASGYRLTGPVLRNGPIYLANVLGREDDLERLVIDARDGRLLQRYAVASGYRRLAASGAWSNRPRLDAAPNDGWLDRDDEAPPRPPAVIDGGGEPRLSLPQPSQIARGDDPGFPRVILAPPGASAEPTLEKPRPKPQAKRKRPDASPVAQPAPNPNPAAPGRPDAAAEASPPAPAPGVADAKPAPEIVASPPVAPAAPQAVAPAPNDVPVAPLE